MAYTQEDFQEWIFQIGFKMDYFTKEFAEKEGLNLNYSMQSLDNLEAWILTHYDDHHALIADRKMLDYLTVYIGETFRKHLGGKWYIDLKNKKNAYYSMPVLTDPSYRGVVYKAPLTYATACISRKDGQYISRILKNNLENQVKQALIFSIFLSNIRMVCSKDSFFHDIWKLMKQPHVKCMKWFTFFLK